MNSLLIWVRVKVILWVGDVFTKCFGTTDKLIQVMKLIGHLSWKDVLRLFNQGSRPYLIDVKNEHIKIQIEKLVEGKGDKLKLANESDPSFEEGFNCQVELLNLLPHRSRSAMVCFWNGVALTPLSLVCRLMSQRHVLLFDESKEKTLLLMMVFVMHNPRFILFLMTLWLRLGLPFPVLADLVAKHQ